MIWESDSIKGILGFSLYHYWKQMWSWRWEPSLKMILKNLSKKWNSSYFKVSAKRSRNIQKSLAHLKIDLSIQIFINWRKAGKCFLFWKKKKKRRNGKKNFLIVSKNFPFSFFIFSFFFWIFFYVMFFFLLIQNIWFVFL